MTHTTLTDHASEIAGKPIGMSWAKCFMSCHPDLKVKWTTGLEECRAQSLNPVVINEFYKMLGELMQEHCFPAENIYNMDKKNIQLGIGKRVAALVDHDQKSVYQVEDGNRELVTIIKTVCADGTALHSSVIYQGIRWDLEWARNNPCNARHVVICDENINAHPFIAYCIRQRDGLIKSWGVYGLSVTLNQLLRFVTDQMDIVFSSSMATTHIAHIASANSPQTITLLLSAFRLTQLMRCNHAMLGFLDHLHHAGKPK